MRWCELDSHAQRRLATYWATGIGVGLGYALLRGSTWQGSTQLHTIMEVSATVLASVVGLMALVRYYSGKNNTFLFIGAGFMGTAFFDGYHALVTSEFLEPYLPSDLASLIPWSWTASRQFLAVMLFLGWLAWLREQRLGTAGQIDARAIYLGTALLALLSFLFFAFVPLPRAYYPEIVFHRPEEFGPALFFMMALYGYLRKGEWRRDAFEHWLVLGLIVGVVGQTAVMSLSGQLFDMEFDVAHLLKMVSYACVLTGLLLNMRATFRRVVEARHEAESNARLLQLTLDNMLDGVSLMDADLNVVRFNAATAKLLEFPEDRFKPGDNLEKFFRFNAERGEYGEGDVDELVAQRIELAGRFEAHVFERTRPDGTVIEVRGNPVPGGGFVTLYTDITVRKRAQEALKENQAQLKLRVSELEDTRRRLEAHAADLAELSEELTQERDRAEAATSAKSEFLANMSHELRTPLNAIIGFADMMRHQIFGPVGNDKYLEYVHDIHKSGEHLLQLINDILDLSKVEAGKLDLHEEEIDVAEVVRSCMVLVKERAEGADLKLVTEVPDGLPLLRADKCKLKQILINLLSNSVKFTLPGGEVRVRAWCAADSGYVLQVADNGIGIAADDIPVVATPFGQADSGLNRRYEGTGLGLPLTKLLVELHGGSLELQSEVEVGTTVTARFPRERIVVQKLRRKSA